MRPVSISCQIVLIWLISQLYAHIFIAFISLFTKFSFLSFARDCMSSEQTVDFVKQQLDSVSYYHVIQPLLSYFMELKTESKKILRKRSSLLCVKKYLIGVWRQHLGRKAAITWRWSWCNSRNLFSQNHLPQSSLLPQLSNAHTAAFVELLSRKTYWASDN